jgi:hypothetical protein
LPQNWPLYYENPIGSIKRSLKISTNYKQFAIARLLNLNYSVFLPISSKPKDYDIIIEYANVLQTAAIINTNFIKSPQNQTTTLQAKLVRGTVPKLREILLCSTYLISCPPKNKVWMIPTEDVADLTCISLQKRYDEYLLVEEIVPTKDPKEVSKFTIAAREAAKLLLKGTNNVS